MSFDVPVAAPGPSRKPTRPRSRGGLALALWLAMVPAAASDGAAARAAQSPGATIGEVTIVRHDVFDTGIEGENKKAYRFANRLHRRTREPVVERLLLFAPGDPYQPALLEETARLLRAQGYLREAEVRAVPRGDGRVDVVVETWDAWTLNPGVQGNVGGGDSEYGIELEEGNVLGTGARFSIAQRSRRDRDETRLTWRHDHQFGRWVGLETQLRDTSDGSGWAVAIGQPFYALGTRRAWGLSVDRQASEEPFYVRGDKVAEYRQRNRDVEVWWGASAGLDGNRVRRWRFGLREQQRRFAPSTDPALVGPVPEDRHLVGPWAGVEWQQDDWAVLRNRDQIGVTEDVRLGLRWTARLGWAGESLGSDRDAAWWEIEASRGYPVGERDLLRLDAHSAGRLEQGRARDATLGARARFYRQIDDRQLFYAVLEGERGYQLDLDGRPTLGSDTGLRGYPDRWANGHSWARLGLERRYFTDWYPGRLFRVGGAVFLDVGRTWGRDALGGDNPGLMADLGVGLRLGNTRSSFARMIHVDLAVPLDDDPALDKVSVVIEARREF
ncbi:hypothetical protein N790_12970 [Arenimonas malthae CC-JY-1]|uniref:POTRA domain-containing protein n=1 Tax=Arenimonas malthae CC-JY-1 TaxID=1384054 RepID=A0A091BKL7_9GAMM|nr:POTRA domain-containing protein [Arenimonas malthae]KFN52072.1 hypothetical protein N790_12970 [Arenimonas malthae CC-JY-1]